MERCRQGLLGVVVGLPRVETNEDLLHPHALDGVEVRFGVVRPRPQAETDAVDEHRFAVEFALELDGSGARSWARRLATTAKSASVVGTVHQSDPELGPPTGVLVGLIREVIPDREVTLAGVLGGRREVVVVAAAMGVLDGAACCRRIHFLKRCLLM